jgi:hypothetical protein
LVFNIYNCFPRSNTMIGRIRRVIITPRSWQTSFLAPAIVLSWNPESNSQKVCKNPSFQIRKHSPCP